MRRLAHMAIAALAVLAFSGWVTAADTNTPTSIYNLEAPLRSQDGRAIGLDVFRGRPVLITMFYGSCPMACPLIIDTLRAVERDLGAQQRADLRVLMISIDPERDTPQALAELAKTRRIDTARWTLAQADEADVRKIAATLGIQYRELPGGEFSHASIITMLNEKGEIVVQSAELGRVDPKLLGALR